MSSCLQVSQKSPFPWKPPPQFIFGQYASMCACVSVYLSVCVYVCVSEDEELDLDLCLPDLGPVLKNESWSNQCKSKSKSQEKLGQT